METFTRDMNVIPLTEQARERAQEQEVMKKYPPEAHPQDYDRFASFLGALEAEKIRVSVTQDGREKVREYAAAEAPAAVLIAARDSKAQVHAQVQGERKYAIVSGLSESALRAMQEDGHTPAVVTETAEGKYQAIMKLSSCSPEQQGQIEDTLCVRYGDGTRQSIVIPGFYSENPPERLPRVVKIDEAAPAQGAARFLDRLAEHAPRYSAQEEATRAYAAKAPTSGIAERTRQKQEEQAPAPGLGFGLGIGDTISKFTQFFIEFFKKLANLIAYALGKEQPFSAVGKIEDRQPPRHWEKTQWNEQELEQQPVFAMKQEAVQEKTHERTQEQAPAQVQEKAQTQEETQARSRGRSR